MQRMNSRRPEGQKGGPESFRLEVGAQRATKLLVFSYFQTIIRNVVWVCWKLTGWVTIGARLQFSPWTLSFSSNFSARTLKFYSSEIGSLYNNQLLTISCTVNIFPCAIHVHSQEDWTEMHKDLKIQTIMSPFGLWKVDLLIVNGRC